MKRLITLTIAIVSLVFAVVLFTPKVYAAGSPYGPYGKKHIPTDTGGTVNSVVVLSIGSYILGSMVYAGAKVLEKKQNA